MNHTLQNKWHPILQRGLQTGRQADVRRSNIVPQSERTSGRGLQPFDIFRLFGSERSGQLQPEPPVGRRPQVAPCQMSRVVRTVSQLLAHRLQVEGATKGEKMRSLIN